MSFLNRGRPVFGRIGRPSEPAPEPGAAVTGLPVTAPASEGVTDDLSASSQLNRASILRLDERHRTETARCNCCNGTPADRRWADAELRRLERLANLTERHGPWAAAQHMYGGTR